MLDEALRSTKDIPLTIIARFLRPVHPLIITGIGFIFGLGAGWFLVRQQYGWGLLFWLINRLLDGLDGAVARLHNQRTDLGGYLDIMADFVIYALVPIGLVFGDPSPARCLGLALLLAAFYVNAASWMYLSALLEKRDRLQTALTSVTMPAGLVGGTETIVFFCIFIIWPRYLTFWFGLMGIMLVITIAQRVRWAILHLE